MSKLVCYGSKQAHSSVERAGLLAGIKMRYIQSNCHSKNLYTIQYKKVHNMYMYNFTYLFSFLQIGFHNHNSGYLRLILISQ